MGRKRSTNRKPARGRGHGRGRVSNLRNSSVVRVTRSQNNAIRALTSESGDPQALLDNSSPQVQARQSSVQNQESTHQQNIQEQGVEVEQSIQQATQVEHNQQSGSGLQQQAAQQQLNQQQQRSLADTSLQWHYKHEINTHVNMYSCHWVDHQHLAVCTVGCVAVHKVTTEGSHLTYTLTSDEWEGKAITDVAVSEAMPNSILVICGEKPYVYQYPCHEATQQVKKYKIHDDEVNPWCIVANDNTAVITIISQYTLVVCSLPDFTHWSHVQTSVYPWDLSITTDYLLVMCDSEMLVKPLSDMSQNLCRILAPDGWVFHSVSFRNNARQIFAGCKQGLDKGFVYKYTWDGVGKPEYVNTDCVIVGLEKVGYKCLSVTSDGLLAVGEHHPHNKVKMYSLE